MSEECVSGGHQGWEGVGKVEVLWAGTRRKYSWRARRPDKGMPLHSLQRREQHPLTALQKKQGGKTQWNFPNLQKQTSRGTYLQVCTEAQKELSQTGGPHWFCRITHTQWRFTASVYGCFTNSVGFSEFWSSGDLTVSICLQDSSTHTAL